ALDARRGRGAAFTDATATALIIALPLRRERGPSIGADENENERFAARAACLTLPRNEDVSRYGLRRVHRLPPRGSVARAGSQGCRHRRVQGLLPPQPQGGESRRGSEQPGLPPFRARAHRGRALAALSGPSRGL